MVSSDCETHTWVPEAILMSYIKQHLLRHLFSSLKWSFWTQTISVPLPLSRPACLRNPGLTQASLTADRQLSPLQTATTAGIFTSQGFYKSWGNSLFSMYTHLHVQFWSRLSHARTHLTPAESRTKLYSTLTGAVILRNSNYQEPFLSHLWNYSFCSWFPQRDNFASLWGTLEDATKYLAGI